MYVKCQYAREKSEHLCAGCHHLHPDICVDYNGIINSYDINNKKI